MRGPVTPRFLPLADGLSFQLHANWVDIVPLSNGKAEFWTRQTAGTILGDPHNGGPPRISKIVGPAVQTGPDTFRVQPARAEYTANRHNNDVWVWGHHPGDRIYKSMVQQAMVRIPFNITGIEQSINFSAPANQKAGTKTLRLGATSDAGLPDSYYVLSGRAEVEGDTLRFTRIPPQAKYPIKVTVVAWQWGRSSEPKVKTAATVERSFFIEQ